MPWDIRANYGGCSGFAVVKKPDGKVVGCHETRAGAREQLAALYSTEPDAAEKDAITNETTPNKNPQHIEEEEDEMHKANSVRVGEMVSWSSSGGRATGKVVRVVRDGKYNVPNSDFTITGTPDDPAVAIRVYRDGKPTDTIVGHKMKTLRSVSKSEDAQVEEVLEPKKTDSLDSAFLNNMPKTARRVNTTGNAPVNFRLFGDQ